MLSALIIHRASIHKQRLSCLSIFRLALLILFLTAFSSLAAEQRQWGPFVIPAATAWNVGGHYDTVRSHGLLYTLSVTGAPSTQVVFFSNTTPNSTEEQHLAYFKRFLRNIRTTYPNASITYGRILDDETPFIRVYDLTGETLFWGTLHYGGTSHDIGITIQERTEDLPADVLELLGTIEINPKKTSNGPAPD